MWRSSLPKEAVKDETHCRFRVQLNKWTRASTSRPQSSTVTARRMSVTLTRCSRPTRSRGFSGASSAPPTSPSSPALTSMATRTSARLRLQGCVPRSSPTKSARCSDKDGPGSTSATTTSSAPPTPCIRRSCRRCSSAALIAATSTSRTMKAFTASDASASTPRRNCYPVTSARCITLRSSSSRRATTS